MTSDYATRPTLDEAVLRQWIGAARTSEDRIDCRQANLLRATIDPDRPELSPGEVLPAGWHWIYFADAPRIDRLGHDGHAALGDFLPPVALPRRMWAGTRLRFYEPIRLEDVMSRTSEVIDVRRKHGRSGELCFVTVRHRYLRGDALTLEEDHDIVYRAQTSGPSLDERPRARTDIAASIDFLPSTPLLFRYSALTFNGHRIHYDLDFCRKTEGYPALVVHAPLVATLMLGLAERYYAGSDRLPREFRQRSVSPLFNERRMTLGLVETEFGCALQAADDSGLLASSAEIELSKRHRSAAAPE